MPTTTYTPIASVTLSASASEVVFSGLPQTYRDLILVIAARSNTTGGSDSAFLQFNGDTGNNYSGVSMSARTSAPTESSATNTRFDIARLATSANSATNFSANVVQIFDYSATDKHKTGLARGNSMNQDVEPVSAVASRWASTAAITSIRIAPIVGTAFVNGSTFNLFGVIA